MLEPIGTSPLRSPQAAVLGVFEPIGVERRPMRCREALQSAALERASHEKLCYP